MTVAAAEIVALALTQAGKPYAFGAEASPRDPNPPAHDCSELPEWVCAREGVEPRMPDGSWIQWFHAVKHETTCSVSEALRTPGALLFRFSEPPIVGGGRPRQAHVAISLGDGRTIEAKSRADGVGMFSAHGRGWTHAALIPGVSYEPLAVTVELPVLRVGSRGPAVRALQGLLGVQADGVFGPVTLAALKAAGFEPPVGADAWSALLA